MLSKIKSIISEILSDEDPIKKRLKEVNELARNFKDIPDVRRERLLTKCTSDLNPQIKTLASDILRHNFDSISENTRNKLMDKLGNDAEIPAGRTYISFCFFNFHIKYR
ncbi:hypothetical protein BEH94_03405 [Candidatus Altiarchaeales archaeon WOR_SM1_SCG]|nr:hypothetical protein BEH94_03405 [Candidatus Altiarchaeales archaeon WOR_SM1_SCG]